MPWSDQELIDCFRTPSIKEITDRTTTIRHAFVAAIVPINSPTPDEIRQVLEILKLTPENLRCSYCGDQATEWGHFHPLVRKGKPSGYPSSIRNLVPACGKCNQSKGSKDWKTWMQGSSRRSPRTRGIKDIEQRISRLEQYENWAKCAPQDMEKLVDPELWHDYFSAQDEILETMRRAQTLAEEITEQIKAHTNTSV
jgi:5-methylcytosine-specific restriction endonuclease McrA